MPTTEGKKLYSPNSAAAVLDCSRSKIYDLMKQGTLPFVLIGSDRRITAEAVNRVAAEGAPTVAVGPAGEGTEAAEKESTEQRQFKHARGKRVAS